MSPVTVSEAVKRSKRTIVIPVLLCLAPMLPLTWLFDRYKVPAAWGLIVIVACFVLMILAGLYFTLKWEIWALQNVDDVQTLKKRMESHPTSMGFPSKWTIGSSADKRLVQELWAERSLKTPILRPAISYDYTLAQETIIYRSRLQNGVLSACLAGMMFISYTKIFDKHQLYPILIAELMAACYFLYKTIFPSLKLKLSAKGIWMRKAGFVSWKDISRIYIQDELKQGSLTELLCISGTAPLLPQEIIFNIKDLNSGSAKLEYVIKNYLSVYNKKASEPLHFG